jgi:hypothetical protein
VLLDNAVPSTAIVAPGQNIAPLPLSAPLPVVRVRLPVVRRRARALLRRRLVQTNGINVQVRTGMGQSAVMPRSLVSIKVFGIRSASKGLD